MDKYLIGTLNNISSKGLDRLTDKFELLSLETSFGR